MYEYTPNRHAALITFHEGTTEEEIKEALAKLANIATTKYEEYDDREAEPHLYFP